MADFDAFIELEKQVKDLNTTRLANVESILIPISGSLQDLSEIGEKLAKSFSTQFQGCKAGNSLNKILQRLEKSDSDGGLDIYKDTLVIEIEEQINMAY